MKKWVLKTKNLCNNIVTLMDVQLKPKRRKKLIKTVLWSLKVTLEKSGGAGLGEPRDESGGEADERRGGWDNENSPWTWFP